MSKLNVFFTILSAGVFALLSTGCGGGGSSSEPKTVDLTVSVNSSGSQKKAKLAKDVSVTEVKGILLSDDSVVEAELDADGNFVMNVPEGSDVRIIATIKNENGSEFNFESFVNDATESDQVVDEDSTRVSTLILSESVNNETTLKDLLAQENDVVEDLREFLKSYDNRDFLTEILASADSKESLENIKARIEAALLKLKEAIRLLAIFEERLDQFEGSLDVIKIDILTVDDIADADTEKEDDLINEFLVRSGDISSIAAGEPNKESDLDISVNEDGSVSVVRDGEVSTTDPVLSRGKLSGRFVACSEDTLTIGTSRTSDTSNTDATIAVDFYISKDMTDLIALVKTFAVDDKLTVVYVVEEEVKVLKAIYAEGYLNGTLAAITKTSVTITLADGTSVEMPLETYEKIIVPLPFETAKRNRSEESTDPIFETVDDETVSTTGIEVNDLTVLDELVDNTEFDVVSDEIKIGDLVIVHWKVSSNVKVATGIFLDKPESFGDPISVDGTRPVSEEDVKDDATDVDTDPVGEGKEDDLLISAKPIYQDIKGDITNGDTDPIREDKDGGITVMK